MENSKVQISLLLYPIQHIDLAINLLPMKFEPLIGSKGKPDEFFYFHVSFDTPSPVGSLPTDFHLFFFHSFFFLFHEIIYMH